MTQGGSKIEQAIYCNAGKNVENFFFSDETKPPRKTMWKKQWSVNSKWQSLQWAKCCYSSWFFWFSPPKCVFGTCMCSLLDWESGDENKNMSNGNDVSRTIEWGSNGGGGWYVCKCMWLERFVAKASIALTFLVLLNVLMSQLGPFGYTLCCKQCIDIQLTYYTQLKYTQPAGKYQQQ